MATVQRPTSIWLTELLLGASALWIGVPYIIAGIICLIQKGSQCWSFRSPWTYLGFIIAFIFHCLIVWGLHHRKKIWRWVAVGYISFLALGVFVRGNYIQLLAKSIFQGFKLPSPPYECWVPEYGNFETSCGYSNYGELILGIIGDILKPALVGLLAYRLIRSKAVQQYFQ